MKAFLKELPSGVLGGSRGLAVCSHVKRTFPPAEKHFRHPRGRSRPARLPAHSLACTVPWFGCLPVTSGERASGSRVRILHAHFRSSPARAPHPAYIRGVHPPAMRIPPPISHCRLQRLAECAEPQLVPLPHCAACASHLAHAAVCRGLQPAPRPPRTGVPSASFTRGHQALPHTGQTGEAEQADVKETGLHT